MNPEEQEPDIWADSFTPDNLRMAIIKRNELYENMNTICEYYIGHTNRAKMEEDTMKLLYLIDEYRENRLDNIEQNYYGRLVFQIIKISRDWNDILQYLKKESLNSELCYQVSPEGPPETVFDLNDLTSVEHNSWPLARIKHLLQDSRMLYDEMYDVIHSEYDTFMFSDIQTLFHAINAFYYIQQDDIENVEQLYINLLETQNTIRIRWAYANYLYTYNSSDSDEEDEDLDPRRRLDDDENEWSDDDEEEIKPKHIYKCEDLVIIPFIPQQDKEQQHQEKEDHGEDDSEEEQECPICYEQFAKKDMVNTQCKHSYCKQCITQSLDIFKKSNKCHTCAICRNNFAFLEIPNNDTFNYITQFLGR